MSITIAITSPETREMKGVGKTSNKPYHFFIQTGYAFTVDKDGVQADFPDKFEFVLEDGQQPYPRGKYTLQPSALFVSRDGKLAVTPRLTPVASSAKG